MTRKYTYTLDQWAAILDGLKPNKYKAHAALIEWLAPIVAEYRKRNEAELTVYPFADLRPLCTLIERRAREIGA